MTPAQQDLIIGRAYGLAIDLLLSHEHLELNGILQLIEKDLSARKLSIQTQLLSVIASCHGKNSEKYPIASDILGNVNIPALTEQFKSQINGISPYLELDDKDNMILLRNVRSSLNLCSSHLQTARPTLQTIKRFLDDLAQDALAYDRLMQ